MIFVPRRFIGSMQYFAQALEGVIIASLYRGSSRNVLFEQQCELSLTNKALLQVRFHAGATDLVELVIAILDKLGFRQVRQLQIPKVVL